MTTARDDNGPAFSMKDNNYNVSGVFFVTDMEHARRGEWLACDSRTKSACLVDASILKAAKGKH